MFIYGKVGIESSFCGEVETMFKTIVERVHLASQISVNPLWISMDSLWISVDRLWTSVDPGLWGLWGDVGM